MRRTLIVGDPPKMRLQRRRLTWLDAAVAIDLQRAVIHSVGEDMSSHDSNVDLDALLLRCQKGDARAWANLVERFQSHVYSVAKRSGLNDEDAADVFQAAFIALYRSLDRLESGRALPKWLATTAGREALRLRRSRHASTVELDAPELGLDEQLASDEREVHEMTETALDSFHVRSALRDMASPCRKLLEALYEENQPSYQEVAERLGIPVGSIGPKRARCLERLRKILVSEGFFSS